MKTIREVATLFDITDRKLHQWEKDGYLGVVERDGSSRNRRIYDEEQIERIRFLIQLMKEQEELGHQRLEKEFVLQRLTEEFGGEVRRVGQQEVLDLSSFMNKLFSIIEQQNQNIVRLEKKIDSLTECEQLVPNDYTKELYDIRKSINDFPKPTDHTDELETIKQQLQVSSHREQELQQTVKSLEDKLMMLTRAMQEQKLRQNELQETPRKRGFWAKWFE